MFKLKFEGSVPICGLEGASTTRSFILGTYLPRLVGRYLGTYLLLHCILYLDSSLNLPLLGTVLYGLYAYLSTCVYIVNFVPRRPKILFCEL